MSNNPARTAPWRKLQTYAAQTPDARDLFKANADRAKKYTHTFEGMTIDFSKNAIDDDILSQLIELAKEQNLEQWRDDMFDGKAVDVTDNRAVLHTALRRPENDIVSVAGENVIPFIHSVLARMKYFSDAVHDGSWRGFTGRPIDTIVNIGIGGSDLGPYMVCEALKAYTIEGMSVFFVSNVDGTHLSQTLEKCNPETTLFLIASKTFTTQETMANAQSARTWLIDTIGDETAISKHFVAMSMNEKAAIKFGISTDNIFPFRDWVGGRFSLWSAIGLSIALAVGFDHFEKLLAGAHAMDSHFREAPLEKNLPVLLGMTGIWQRNFMKRGSHAVLPYDQNLHRFPVFLQQLEMESNGKRVDRDGNLINDYHTGPVVFGEPGTNGQHAFYQLLHQGTDIIPCDFIGVKNSNYPLGNHHALLMTNMLAQSRALMEGRVLEQAGSNSHRVFPGNRPSTTIILDTLDPYHLGMLIALYEHKVFVQGIIWNINSFDQFGVELGKEIANAIGRGGSDTFDPSTDSLKDRIGL